MRLLTVSNLYPRPDRPQFGLFNAQLFAGMAAQLAASSPPSALPAGGLRNVCLVPSWRPWQWAGIRAWQSPHPAPHPTAYVPAFYVPAAGRGWSWLSYRAALGPCRRLARESDAVYSAWLYPDGVVGARLARAAGVPAWIMVLGSDILHLRHPLRREVILGACRGARGLVCVWRGLADSLAEAGVDPGRIHVVPNGVDTGLFCFRSADSAWQELRRRHAQHGAAWIGRPVEDRGRPGSTKMVLFVGNLVSVKQPGLLLDAWAAVQRAGAPGSDRAGVREPPHLLILGDGPLRPALELQARRLGVSDTVVFLGRRPHDEVPLWMNYADCLCLCSRSEGMPNVVCEALASGLPVVASDVGACGEMVAGEAAARLVRPNAAAALAGALCDLLAQDADRAALAARHGRRSWGDQAREIVELIAGQGEAGR